MPRLKVHFDDPVGGWMDLSIGTGDEQEVRYNVSDIFPSFDLLVKALICMWEGESEANVTWALEPSELDFLFSRQDDRIRLEVILFPGSFRPYKNEEDTIFLGSFRPGKNEKILPIFTFVGSYEQTCLPFWQALRELESRYSQEELAHRWTWPFPHNELALLTKALSKD